MVECSHELLPWEQKDQESMHCVGWFCQRCCDLQLGECHHQSWCRRDFCGSDPVVEEVASASLGAGR